MDKIIKKILKSFNEISILDEEDGITFFNLMEKDFGIIYSNSNLMPLIVIRNEETFDYPHIMIKEYEHSDGYKYRRLIV